MNSNKTFVFAYQHSLPAVDVLQQTLIMHIRKHTTLEAKELVLRKWLSVKPL